MKRLKEATGDQFLALHGEDQLQRDAAYNLKYCTLPIRELLEQYNKLVDDSQVEIDGLHRMLDSKRLDISKL